MEKTEPTVSFGHAMRDKHFNFAKGYIPLNHGSFGTFPAAVRERQRELQDLMEARPDKYLRYTYLEQLEESRGAIAPLIGASIDEVVFIPNATTGVNTVLRNLVYEEGDVILHFSTVYGACKKTIESLCETTPVEGVSILIEYPIEDEDIALRFRDAVLKLRNTGKNVKVGIFETVLTFPGVRFPWEAMVKTCKDLGILSVIDGAHGIGHIDLTNMGEVGPDFFTSNCYKWLFVPRGCAVLYVPCRNQHLIRTSLPTSWGFQPLVPGEEELGNQKAFGELFKKVSTVDPTPYECIQAAMKFRELVCGGDSKIREYCEEVARLGGKRMAEIFGTEVMKNSTGTLQQCCFVNVRLPLTVSQDVVSDEEKPIPGNLSNQAIHDSLQDSVFIRAMDAPKIAKLMTERSIKEYETMIPVK